MAIVRGNKAPAFIRSRGPANTYAVQDVYVDGPAEDGYLRIAQWDANADQHNWIKLSRNEAHELCIALLMELSCPE